MIGNLPTQKLRKTSEWPFSTLKNQLKVKIYNLEIDKTPSCIKTCFNYLIKDLKSTYPNFFFKAQNGQFLYCKTNCKLIFMG